MKNSLFLVCPFGHSEQFIRRNQIDNAFFVTGIGGYITFEESNFCQEFNKKLIDQQIESIYLVQNTECRFLKNSIKEQFQDSLGVRSIHHKIYTENISQFKKLKTDFQITVHLAYLMIKKIADDIYQNPILSPTIKMYHIEIKGTLIHPEESRLSSFNLNQNTNFA
jgi:hypothetical protein